MATRPQDWETIKALFQALLDEPPPRRLALLREHCADPSLCAEVERLLVEHDGLGSFLSTPAFIDNTIPPSQPGKRFVPGEVLAERFRIVSFIAAGGMGEVYEAEDLVLKENLAIKTIRSEVLQQSNALARFKREVQLARKVTNPSICRVFDLFWHKKAEGDRESVVFVSMELLRGETLSERIRRKGRFSPREALPLINQIASGLDAAHRAGVVHRDLKPGNVILVPGSNREDIRSVITDFGLALRTGMGANGSLDLTTSHGVFGTPAYMAPEQIEGKEVTKHADIYALGLIIYEMVTGEHAFPADTPLASVAKRFSDPLVSPKRIAPELSDNWEHAINRCLERDPNARFLSCSEVVAALSDPTFIADKIPRYRGSVFVVTSVLTLLLLIAGTAYQFRGRLASPSLKIPTNNAAMSSTPRIAILPFHNSSNSATAENLSDSIAEEVIVTLGQSHGSSLRVLAKGSCLKYRDTTKSPLEIARELNVQYLVIGSVNFVSEKFEVEVQLVNGSDQSVLWANKYSGQVSQIQAEVADSIARQVQVTLLPEAATALQVGNTSNPLAHEAYLRGKLDIERKNYESSHRALREFHDATVLDPKYALAYAGISELYINFANSEPTGPSYAKAKQAALTAIRLDDRVAEAHRDLAWVLDNNEFDWPGAEREYRRALELNPSDARAYHWYAQHLVALGKMQDAVREARIGLDLDPLSEGSNYNYAFILMYNGQYDAAIDHLKAELLREPNSEVVNGYLGLTYRFKQDYQSSISAFRRTVEVSNSKPAYVSSLAISLSLAGKRPEALHIAKQLRQEYDHGRWVPAFNLALMYFGLGNKDEGYRFLRLALAEHSCTLLEINTDPLFLGLRGEPRFETIRSEFHLPESSIH